MKCGQTVSGSFQSSDCRRDATQFNGDAFGRAKPADLSIYSLQQYFYCNVHAAALKRSRYRTVPDFIPVTDERVKPYAERLLVLMAERNAEVRADNEKKAAEASERSKARNKRDWEAYDASVSLKATEEHEDRYTRAHHEFQWKSAPQTPDARFYDAYSVEVVYDDIRATDEWQGIDPVYVRVRSTGTFTPAHARAVAESLLLAARKAEEVTGQRGAARDALLEPK